jgi:hypothetical protein
MASIKVCDRCKAETRSESNVKYTHLDVVNEKIDLCNQCADSFKGWMNQVNAKKEFWKQEPKKDEKKGSSLFGKINNSLGNLTKNANEQTGKLF